MTAILIPALAFASPANTIEFIDISTNPDYCNDLPAAYDAGVELSSYSNVINIGSFADNSATSYELFVCSLDLDRKYKHPQFFDYDYMKITDQNKMLRFLPDSSIDGIVVDFYLASNIKSSAVACRLFKARYTYRDFDLFITPDFSEDDEYTTIEESRKLLSVYGGFSDSKIWRMTTKHSTDEQELLLSYVALIRYNPSISASAVDFSFNIRV